MTIDAITGLPLVGSAGDINSIPLGQQVFPYDDLDAAARPSRLPLYPDDVIPVSSVTVGMRKKVPNAITSSMVNDPEGGTSKVAALNVNVAGGSSSGGSLGNATVFTDVWSHALGDEEPYSASGPFTPAQGIVALQFWAVGAAQEDEWQPQYLYLHIGPNGTTADPIMLVISPYHQNVGGAANPQFVTAHAELSFPTYINQNGTWKGVALKAFFENASPGFGWVDGAGFTVYYV